MSPAGQFGHVTHAGCESCPPALAKCTDWDAPQSVSVMIRFTLHMCKSKTSDPDDAAGM